MNRNKLTPISFHLVNFNHYIDRKIFASKKGNFTLIGENAAGKTTLANCFFPMLIDGSIATPSFNPAKGTDKIEKTTTRNSKNDTRTFENMMLGWGKGAMKVRTGYSYLLMKSNTRQVIVGIGAHRAVGENRKPTWWFVAISKNPDENLELQTKDIHGEVYLKDEFTLRNANLGDEFKVFTTLSEFQSYVADVVYGFNDLRSLHQLANAYRLLASPILTAGNSRLTPILEAMKNAQEGIDSQIIESVADTQREVNRKKATLERISRGETKLTRMKKEIFWRNLNRIGEKFLDNYGYETKKLNQQKTQSEKLAQHLVGIEKQLVILEPQLEQSKMIVQELLEQKAKQAVIEERRKDKLKQVKYLQQHLANYITITKKIAELTNKLDAANKELDTLQLQNNQIVDEMNPIIKKLLAKLANLNQITLGFTDDDLSNSINDLKHYIRKMKGLVKDHQNIVDNQKRLSEDIEIVSEIRVNMDDKIDVRVSNPVLAKIRNYLHQDNLDVHNTGAAKMDTNFQILEQKRQDLLITNPDLRSFLDDTGLSSDLRSLADDLDKLANERHDFERQIQDKSKDLEYLNRDIKHENDRINSDYNGFDVDQTNKDIDRINAEIATLKIDEDLDHKISIAKDNQVKFETSRNQLNNDKVSTQTNINNNQVAIRETEENRSTIQTQTENNLTVLKPYMINEIELDTIDDAMEFLSSHKTEIKNNSYSELSDKIGSLIRNNNQNGIDQYALDDIFEERGYPEIASQMRQNRSIQEEDLVVVPFNLNRAQDILKNDDAAVEKSLDQLQSGNMVAQTTYLEAAVHQISDQYDLIDGYNEMLAHGVKKAQGIQLKVSLKPDSVDESVIEEARDTSLNDRPNLLKEVQSRLQRLANDLTIADDDELFMKEAQKLLDIRQWSNFQIWIHRKQAEADEFELVDDKFVQSGGSGAEKAQAMVLPLLLVPKMILHRSNINDAPHLIMFDEFADKLDPETAKSFAQTIDQFGFNFIATMPSGSQNKILADGVDNIAYDVIPPKNKNDGRFHENNVKEAVIWTEN